jgi:hypothetical protein
VFVLSCVRQRPRGRPTPHTGQHEHRKEADMNVRLPTMAVYEQSQTLRTIDHVYVATVVKLGGVP